MKKQIGFSLIELLVAMAIIGVVSAVAYPSYTSAMRKSHRTDAMVDLNDLAQRLQRCFTTNSTFLDTSGAANEKKCAVQVALRTADGVISEKGYYRINGSNFTATAYTLTATPVVGRSQEADSQCQQIILDQAGARSSLDSYNADSTVECWK